MFFTILISIILGYILVSLLLRPRQDHGAVFNRGRGLTASPDWPNIRDRYAEQISQIFPHVSLDDIKTDLNITGDMEATTERILMGYLPSRTSSQRFRQSNQSSADVAAGPSRINSNRAGTSEEIKDSSTSGSTGKFQPTPSFVDYQEKKMKLLEGSRVKFYNRMQSNSE